MAQAPDPRPPAMSHLVRSYNNELISKLFEKIHVIAIIIHFLIVNMKNQNNKSIPITTGIPIGEGAKRPLAVKGVASSLQKLTILK